MRAGLNTIQQTLTPEAANVLNHSITEVDRGITGKLRRYTWHQPFWAPPQACISCQDRSIFRVVLILKILWNYPSQIVIFIWGV